MQKFQIDQFDMLLSVENHFDDNPTAWSDNVPLIDAKNVLSSNIGLLAIQVAIQLLNPTGSTLEKNNLRDALQTKGFVVSAAVSAYAATTGKSDLYKRVNLTKTDYERYRDAELLGVISNLHREARIELDNLVPYGVSEPILVDLIATNEAFGAAMKNPEQAIARRVAATNAIDNLLPATIIILETRIDNLMIGLQATQPQFVAIYNVVRALKNSPTNPLSVTITTLNAITNEPVAKTKLEIVGEGISRTSSQRGYNTIQNLIPGPHQLKVEHPNYTTQTVPFTIISGETTELVVLLEPVVV